MTRTAAITACNDAINALSRLKDAALRQPAGVTPGEQESAWLGEQARTTIHGLAEILNEFHSGASLGEEFDLLDVARDQLIHLTWLGEKEDARREVNRIWEKV